MTEVQKDRNRGKIDQFRYINILTWLRGENGLLPELQDISEPPTVTEEELLTVARKPNNIAYKSSDDHKMELDEQS